jgi:hypothetical protein
VASVLVTNLIVVAPVLLLARRWRLPFGTVALVAGAGAVGLTSLREFALGALVPAMVAGGLAADVLVARLRPGPDRPGAFRAVAALVPLLLWGAWMATYAIAYGVAWPPELWAGVLGMACLGGLGPERAGPAAGRARRGLGSSKCISALNLDKALLWTSGRPAAPHAQAKGGCADGRQRIPTTFVPVDTRPAPVPARDGHRRHGAAMAACSSGPGGGGPGGGQQGPGPGAGITFTEPASKLSGDLKILMREPLRAQPRLQHGRPGPDVVVRGVGGRTRTSGVVINSRRRWPPSSS